MKIVFKPFGLNLSVSHIKKPQKPTPMRMVDILLQEEEEEEEEEGGGGRFSIDFLMDNCTGRRANRWLGRECPSPRRIIGRLMSRLRRDTGRKSAVGSERRRMEREDGTADVWGSRNGLTGGDSLGAVPERNEPGSQRGENSFNMAIGYCLLHLMASSKNELEKMVELRKQMEVLLANVNVLERKDVLSEPPALRGAYAYSKDAPESPESNDNLSLQILPASFTLPEVSTVTLSDKSFRFNIPDTEETSEGIDELEAELQAELERLQLHLETEKCTRHPEERRMKVPINDTASSTSHGFSSAEVIDPGSDPQEVHSNVNCGVPPLELERRLHELLEARQQEQIRELEAALEHANQKLHEKEMEVFWWKETAGLVSQHIQ